MKVKVFSGRWDSWGIEASYCHYTKAFTFALLNWWVAIEFWTKAESEAAANRQQELEELFLEMQKSAEEELKKAKEKKPAKKKAAKPAEKKANPKRTTKK